MELAVTPYAPFVEQRFSLQRKAIFEPLEQWVQSVISFSSQYNAAGWFADMLIGPPRVFPRYGDIEGAWAPGRFHSMESIQLRYAKPVLIERVEIYETNLPGTVTRIEASVGDEWVTLYEGSPRRDLPPQARIFSPSLSTRVISNVIRLELNCTELESWAEIDCVKLIGSEAIEKASKPLTPLSRDIKNLFESRIYGDITFIVEGREIKAHRCILWARSDVFKAMLASQMSESATSRVEITDFTYSVFYQMLEYLYTGDVDIKDNLLGLYCAADKYNFIELKDICLEELRFCLTPDNVSLVLLTVSEMQGISQPLVDVCLKFIQDHIHSVIKSKNFELLPRHLVVSILQDLVDKRPQK